MWHTEVLEQRVGRQWWDKTHKSSTLFNKDFYKNLPSCLRNMMNNVYNLKV